MAKINGIAKYIDTKSCKLDPITKTMIMKFRFKWWKAGYWVELFKMTFFLQTNIIQTAESQKLVIQQAAQAAAKAVKDQYPKGKPLNVGTGQ